MIHFTFLSRSLVSRSLFGLLLTGVFAALGRAQIPERIDREEQAAHRLDSRGRNSEALKIFLGELEDLAAVPAGDASARREVGARSDLVLLLADPLVRELGAWQAAGDSIGKVLEHPSDPLFRARAILYRWMYERSRSDLLPPSTVPEGIGLLTDWVLIGPFDNEQGGGFDRDFPPEKELKLDAVYDGKDRKVSWRRVPIPGKAALDLRYVFKPNEQCLAYALCAVRCNRETPVALRLATAEGVKVFVNGSEVFSRNVRRPRMFDQDAVGVVLPPGWSSIVLKVAHRTGGWGFVARITDPQGEPLAGLETTADPALLRTLSFPAEKPATVETRQGAQETLEKAAAANPDDPWAQFRLGMILDTVRPLDDADTKRLECYQTATRLDPKNPIFLYSRAHASIRPAEMTPEREENAYRRDLEAVLALDPDYAVAALDLANYYVETLRIPSRAETYLDRALRTNPAFLDAQLLQGRVLHMKGLDAQADSILLRIEKDPLLSKRTAFLDEWISFLRDRKRFAEARAACLKALIVERRNAPALDALTSLYESAGRPDEALTSLDELIETNPYDSDAWVRKANLLEAYGRLDEAIEACARAIEINPQDDSHRQVLATLLHRSGRRDEAIAELEEARRQNPKDPWTERYLHFLRGEKRPFEEEIRTDPAALAAQAKGVTAQKNEPYAYLLRDTTLKANADGTATRYEHLIVKVLNPRGAVEFDRYPVPFAMGEQQVEVLVNRTIHADGTTTQGRIIGTHGAESESEYQTWRLLWIDPPTIEVGDVVELAFRVKDVQQSFFGDYFGYSHGFYAPDLVPVRDSRFTLIRPKSRNVYLNIKNGAPEAVEGPGDEEGTVAYRFEMKDLPAIDAEPLMPPPDEFLPTVEATTYGSWDEFAGWWWNLIQREFDASEAMKKKVQELTAGLDDPLAKARAIYDFVVSDIRYEAWEFGVHGYKPYRTATVFDRGFGDCKDKAILLCTLLKEIGVHAVPVLLHAEMERPKEDLSLPLVSHFNHCIAYADLPGGPQYLDGTAQFHSLGTVPDMDRGAHVLEVAGGRAKLAQIPEADPAASLVDEGYEVAIGENSSAVIRGAVQADGSPSVEVRARFVNVGRREDLIAGRFGDLFGKAHVTTTRFSDLRNLDEPTRYSFELQVPDFFKRSGNELTAPLTFRTRSLRPFAATETRKFDLLLPPPLMFRSKIRYRLPGNVEVAAMPEGKTFDTPFGHYHRTVRQDGEDLVVESELALAVRRVASADYPAFREFCLQVSETEESVLHLRPVSSPR